MAVLLRCWLWALVGRWWRGPRPTYVYKEGGEFQITRVAPGIYEVCYRDCCQGVIGVSLDAPADRPYGYSMGQWTPCTVGFHNPGYRTIEEPLDLLCRRLKAQHRKCLKLDHTKTCSELRNFFEQLPN